MQAIILATDEQRGLVPLIDTLPAPLMPVVDRPVMARTVEVLARAGHKRILVSLYNRGGSIAAQFGSGRKWGVDIKYITQREAWGSAGAIKWAARLLNEVFLVVPGEIVLDLDIEAAFAFHKSHGGPATVILHAQRDNNSATKFRLAPNNRITTDATVRELSGTGAFIFEPTIFRHIPDRTPYDCLTQLIPSLLAANEAVHGYEMSGYWNPLQTLSDYKEAQNVYLYSAYRQRVPELSESEGPSARVRFPSLDSRQIAPGIWVGLNHSIHPSVKMAAPIYIGETSWIGREVELGAGSIIGSNVVIDEEATITASTILSGTYVGRLLKINQRIVNATTIMDPESGDCIRVVDPFLLSHVGVTTNGPNPLVRMLHKIGGLVGLIAVSPLLMIVWLLNMIVTGMRPFTRISVVGQRIEGTDGTATLATFQLLNFKTKRANGSYTLLGRLLERLEFNRLPELWNVIVGDMNLVGVKPLPAGDTAQLTEEWQQKHHDGRTGFTGLWYLQTNASSDLDAILIADVYYTATRTWNGDMLILLRTPLQWIRRCIQLDGHSKSDSELLVHADNVRST